MAITSEIIGKLGGGFTKEEPVSGTASGKVGSTVTLSTIEVPLGESWLISVVGNASASSDSRGNWPDLFIGETAVASPTGVVGVSAVATGTVDIGIGRVISYGSDSFTGHVYTVKM